MILIGPVIFSNIQATQLIDTNSDITIHNYVQYSNITASELITGNTETKIKLIENAYVYITNNYLAGSLFQMQNIKSHSYPFCCVQYYKKQTEGENKPHHTKIPIIFIDSNNNITKTLDENMKNVNCKWDPKSLYYGANPLKRYFAGYYIICRLVIIIIIIINSSINFPGHFVLIILCTTMALIHLVVKPYASDILNVFDGLIL